jgi:hypothetical protein
MHDLTIRIASVYLRPPPTRSVAAQPSHAGWRTRSSEGVMQENHANPCTINTYKNARLKVVQNQHLQKNRGVPPFMKYLMYQIDPAGQTSNTTWLGCGLYFDPAIAS